MKKLILFTLLFTFFFSTAQKKELRNANKFFISGEYSSAIDLLDSAKDVFDSSDDKIKSQVMLLYGKLHTSMEDFELAMKAFDMSKNLGISEQVLDPEIRKLETAIITSAVISRDFLKSKIMNIGTMVYIKCGDFDNFGRILGNIYFENPKKKIDIISINDIMIKKGYGIEYNP